ncbi:MAG: CRISPR-associated endonuclease Cas2 [Bacilli bacterium]|jgi:CRISPR-associated protein Cas2|nr:CRISPR-associated endonuclease Cas2 [Bacilli bacterium]
MITFREMRLLVMFDLPMVTVEEKSEANKFRRILKNEGFIMVQYSVYSRYCRNDTEFKKYIKKIKAISPKTKGEIRLLKITEKQYNSTVLISSHFKTDEELLSISPLVIIE